LANELQQLRLGESGMPTFLMIAVVALNVIILVFGICSGLEMYLASRRRKVAAFTDPANIYTFPNPSVKPVPKKPAA
jgi:hypothetical protein